MQASVTTKIIKPNEILEQANEFYAAAQQCTRTDGKSGYLLIAGNVNLAFACELYLKAISLQKNIPKPKGDGHNLQALYDSLDDYTRKGIWDEYGKAVVDFAKRLHENLEKKLGRKMPEPQTCIKHENIEREIDFMLPEYANTFKEWRYIYEKANGKYSIAGSSWFDNFAKALRTYAQSIISADKENE